MGSRIGVPWPHVLLGAPAAVNGEMATGGPLHSLEGTKVQQSKRGRDYVLVQKGGILKKKNNISICAFPTSAGKER